MSGRLDFEYKFNSNHAQAVEPETPMRVYFLGDFTGRRSADKNNTVKQDYKNRLG